jgi:L-amino acid N-acyltransferase YncA
VRNRHNSRGLLQSATGGLILRNVSAGDASSISEIYNHYVSHTTITFEETPVVSDEMRERIIDITRSYPWLVCEEDGNVIGYSYATKWRERAAYRFTVEATVYLHPSSVGKGRGSALLSMLLAELRKRQVHSVIGGIALPNAASVALFEKFGFHQAAHFKEAGYKFGRWIDVGNWELLL